MLRGTRSFKHVFYRIKHILFLVGSISLTPDCIGSRLDIEMYKSTRLSFPYFSPGPFKFTDTLMSKLRMYKEEKNPSKQTIGLDSNYLKSENPNFVVYQVSLAFGISLSHEVLCDSGSFLVWMLWCHALRSTGPYHCQVALRLL